MAEGGIHLCVFGCNWDFSPLLLGEEGPVRGISGSSSHGMGSCGAAPWKGSKAKDVEAFCGHRVLLERASVSEAGSS